MNNQGNQTLRPVSERIVVGHDGSAGADMALSQALWLGERLGVGVLVVRAWSIDSAPADTLVNHGRVYSFDEASAKIADLLTGETRDVIERHRAADVTFRACLGQPASVLVTESEGALMLVVGSRGRGGFASLMLGSISEQCTRHARCPVLVVRPRTALNGAVDVPEKSRANGA